MQTANTLKDQEIVLPCFASSRQYLIYVQNSLKHLLLATAICLFELRLSAEEAAGFTQGTAFNAMPLYKASSDPKEIVLNLWGQSMECFDAEISALHFFWCSHWNGPGQIGTREKKKGPCGGSGESIEFLPVEDRLSLLFFQFFLSFLFFFGGLCCPHCADNISHFTERSHFGLT